MWVVLGENSNCEIVNKKMWKYHYVVLTDHFIFVFMYKYSETD